jgi:LPXTG-motif cell wall-anchored protein
VGLGVVLAGTVAGLIGFAGVASAHTHKNDAYCKGDTTTLHVNLTAYADKGRKGQQNHVTVTDGATSLVDAPFDKQFVKAFDTSGAEDHVFTVKVTAWDDAKYSFTEEFKVAKCVTPPPPDTETTTTTTTTESVPPPPVATTTSPVAAPVISTTTTPAPQAAPALAETGASIAIPLGIGGVLLAGGVALLFVVRRRSKA